MNISKETLEGKKAVTEDELYYLCAKYKDYDLTKLDVNGITDMSDLFQSSRAFNQDIGNWNVGSVTDMTDMFYNANAFNQDIGGWDVSKVTNMSFMFYNAHAFNQDISGWDVGGVMNMCCIFNGATAFNQDIGGWDVSNVTDMFAMFLDANVFNQNIGSWSVAKVTAMNSMFNSAGAFNQDIGGWDVSNVTNMSFMFFGAKAFNQNIGDWDVSNVKNMNSMLEDASSFNQNICGWNISSVTEMNHMLSGAIAFNQDNCGWDTNQQRRNNMNIFKKLQRNKVVTESELRILCRKHDDYDLTKLDVSNVTDMSFLFRDSEKFNQDISNWDVSDVTDMYGMFWDAYAFNQDISCWDVGNVTNMTHMFHDAKSFNQDIGRWDMRSVTDRYSMLKGASAFNQDLSGLGISKTNKQSRNNIYGEHKEYKDFFELYKDVYMRKDWCLVSEPGDEVCFINKDSKFSYTFKGNIREFSLKDTDNILAKKWKSISILDYMVENSPEEIFSIASVEKLQEKYRDYTMEMFLLHEHHIDNNYNNFRNMHEHNKTIKNKIVKTEITQEDDLIDLLSVKSKEGNSFVISIMGQTDGELIFGKVTEFHNQWFMIERGGIEYPVAYRTVSKVKLVPDIPPLPVKAETFTYKKTPFSECVYER